MTRSIYIVFLVVVYLLHGCATSPEQQDEAKPDWINGESEKFNHRQYLVGVGQAKKLAVAKDRARADLAKNFVVAVQERSEDTQRFSQSTTGDSTPSFESEAARVLKTRTEKVLHGVEIADVWQDTTSNTYHALAVLSRLRAASRLREEISDLDLKVREYVAGARDVEDQLSRIGYATRAVDTHAQRDVVNSTLRVIDFSGRGIDSQWRTAQLDADLQALLSRLNIVVGQVEGARNTEIQNMLGGALAKAGFSQDSTQIPDYAVDAAMRFDKPHRIDGVHWTTGLLEIRLRQVQNNRVRGTKTWEVKAGSSVGAEIAERQALEKVRARLDTQLRDVLLGFAG